MRRAFSAGGFTLIEILVVSSIVGLLAALATPYFVTARNTSRTAVCINNLRQIQAAKEQYAIFENAADDTEITNGSDLDPYLRGGFARLICPANGHYTVHTLDTNATCDIPNHVLPPD